MSSPHQAPPYEAPASGDGQLGVFEGLTSDIDILGKQPQVRRRVRVMVMVMVRVLSVMVMVRVR